jgi:glycosyltransferase involved in cell wall biosynthesis
LIVVGEWDECDRASLLRDDPSGVTFVGHRSDLTAVFSTACIYLHPGRGDAFPLSVLEAMAAGLVPIVSEWTGTKEVVEQVDPMLVCPLDARVLAERIQCFMNLSISEKVALSNKAREVVSTYTEEHAVKVFKDNFGRIVNAFNREKED